MVYVHIWAALVAILFGFASLFFRKGSRLHRATGNVFFVSMLAMTSIAAFRAAFATPAIANVLVGVLTFYLVASSWLTVRRKEGQTGVTEIVLMLMALTDGIAGWVVAWQATNSATGLIEGAPPIGYFIIGALALFAAGSDIRLLVRRGVSGAYRIARHLWRMSFALLIATASLFLGQQKVIPEAMRGSPLLFVPVIIVVVLMIYWLVRVRYGKTYRKSPKQRQIAPATPGHLAH
jgi:uncharacterized membrane protein